MSVGKEHRVNTTDLVCKRLVAEIGASVDQDDPTVVEREACGRSISMVSRVFRSAHLTRTPWEGNSR